MLLTELTCSLLKLGSQDQNLRENTTRFLGCEMFPQFNFALQ
jgi:hypothetical protein